MESNKTKAQDTSQQDSVQAKPVVVENPAHIEQPTETASVVDTTSEITPESVPAEQAKEETPTAEPPIEQTTVSPASPEERPLSASLPEDSPPTSQPSTPPQPQERIIYKTDPNIIQKLLIKARAKIQERKRKKLDKIMVLFEAKPQVMNKDIQKLLRISSSTTVRYMNILEQENRVKQVGNTGKSVFYTKI